ncbi:MAG TPA: FHA domain-containing protein [Ardenticatenaceae bacterium]|nr:FHA domain-containing protein [Ardenticatenaceae bacterium]
MAELTLEWEMHGEAHSYTVSQAGTVSIGRQSDNAIVLAEPAVSRRHAEIFAEGDVFRVRNLSATNPVRLNNQVRLEQGQTAALKPGDSLQLGPVHLKVAAMHTPTVKRVPKIKCITCGHISDYDPEEFCKWCGTALSAGQTVLVTMEDAG